MINIGQIWQSTMVTKSSALDWSDSSIIKVVDIKKLSDPLPVEGLVLVCNRFANTVGKVCCFPLSIEKAPNWRIGSFCPKCWKFYSGSDTQLNFLCWKCELN